jgi:hypothetical protein
MSLLFLPALGGAGLLQRIVDVRELGVQVGTEAVDHSDYRNRNAGGNQAVFDGGGSGFVIQETRTKLGHLKLQGGRRLRISSPRIANALSGWPISTHGR